MMFGFVLFVTGLLGCIAFIVSVVILMISSKSSYKQDEEKNHSTILQILLDTSNLFSSLVWIIVSFKVLIRDNSLIASKN
jgi:hypothetical protein